MESFKVLHVYLPESLRIKEKSFLLGQCHNWYDIKLNCNILACYILGTADSIHEKGNTNLSCDVVGQLEKNNDIEQRTYKKSQKFWIAVRKCERYFDVDLVSPCIKMSKLNIIIFDPSDIVSSFLFKPSSLPRGDCPDDAMTKLLDILSVTRDSDLHVPKMKFLQENNCITSKLFSFMLSVKILFEVYTPKFIVAFLTRIFVINLLRTRCLQFVDVFSGSESRRLRVGNFVLSLAIDLVGGVILVSLLCGEGVLYNLFFDCVSLVIRNLLVLIPRLMGAPVGLKLNSALSAALGKFFLYHIHLWTTYMDVMAPLLRVVFETLSLLKFAGLTLILSGIVDLTDLATFHIYCFYIYATRIYRFQIEALVQLLRLFLGKKYNPLRDRVDSCSYVNEQLFVGTLLFAIFLFLAPTIVLYYFVFLGLRCVIILFCYFIKVLVELLVTFPLYSVILFLFRSKEMYSHFELKVVNNAGGKCCSNIVMSGIVGSFNDVLKKTKLTSSSKLNFPNFSNFLLSIIKGNFLLL